MTAAPPAASSLRPSCWDHTSRKALIRGRPEPAIVPNETQKREAIEFHRVPADRALVTSSQGVDQVFDREPSGSKS